MFNIPTRFILHPRHQKTQQTRQTKSLSVTIPWPADVPIVRYSKECLEDTFKNRSPTSADKEYEALESPFYADLKKMVVVKGERTSAKSDREHHTKIGKELAPPIRVQISGESKGTNIQIHATKNGVQTKISMCPPRDPNQTTYMKMKPPAEEKSQKSQKQQAEETERSKRAEETYRSPKDSKSEDAEKSKKQTDSTHKK